VYDGVLNPSTTSTFADCSAAICGATSVLPDVYRSSATIWSSM
jgi:hypothetical protein